MKELKEKFSKLVEADFLYTRTSKKEMQFILSLIDRVEELEKDLVYLDFLETENKQLQQQNESFREALDESNKELIIIQGNIYQEIQKGNKQWDGVDKVLYQRIESNRQALKTDEEIDYESQDDPRTRGLNNG